MEGQVPSPTMKENLLPLKMCVCLGRQTQREEQAMKPDWYVFDEAYDLDNVNNEDREEAMNGSGQTFGYQYADGNDIWYN